jgi:hypothetical protein
VCRLRRAAELPTAGDGLPAGAGEHPPAHVLSKRKLDRWRVRYVARVAGSRYPVHGLVTVVHSAGDIRGFALARVYAPQSKGPVADAILASFTTR